MSCLCMLKEPVWRNELRQAAASRGRHKHTNHYCDVIHSLFKPFVKYLTTLSEVLTGTLCFM